MEAIRELHNCAALLKMAEAHRPRAVEYSQGIRQLLVNYHIQFSYNRVSHDVTHAEM